MKQYTVLIFAVLGAVWWQAAEGQYYDQALYSDNGMPWRGEMGPIEFCPIGSGNTSFTYALEFKYDDLDDLDFIGGDSVKLYCRDENGMITGYISSLQGTHGEWQGLYSCPQGEFFTGFRLRVYPEQGTWGDDFAVDNIQLACSDGTVVDGLEGINPPAPFVDVKRAKGEDETDVVRKWTQIMGRWVEVVSHRKGAGQARLNGNWGSWAYCSTDMYVMAIRTVVEEGHIDDDAGLTDVTLYCSYD